MRIIETNADLPISSPPDIPLLEEGQELDGDEFMRRWEAMPELRFAELIEGVVHMGSPLRYTHHAKPQLVVGGWISMYISNHPEVEGGMNPTLCLDLKNHPQPDGVLLFTAEHGGQAKLTAKDYFATAPELVIEVSASTKKRDLGKKKQIYLKHGVKEYIVWRIEDETVDWFVVRNAAFEPLALSPEGWFKSETFPGLWLDPEALLRFDLPRLFHVLAEGRK